MFALSIILCIDPDGDGRLFVFSLNFSSRSKAVLEVADVYGMATSAREVRGRHRRILV